MGGGGANSLIKSDSENSSYVFKSYDEFLADYNVSSTTMTSDDFVGNGSASNPYLVKSLRGFLYLTSKGKSGYVPSFNLDCDIILNDETFDENGTPHGGDGVVYEWAYLQAHNSEFDGNGHKISGLYCVFENSNSVGLFSNAPIKSVKNLKMENCYVLGKEFVGAFGPGSGNSVVENCKVYGTVRGESRVGGIIGTAKTILNCNNYATVITTVSTVSGIAYNIAGNGLIENCKNYGKIIGTSGVGIVSAIGNKGVMKNCINYGEVIAETGSASGIVGTMYGVNHEKTILNCINYGKIVAKNSWKVAGIVLGVETKVNIINCQNYGKIEYVPYNFWGINLIPGEIVADIDSIYYDNAEVNIINCKVNSNNGLPIIGRATGNSSSKMYIKINIDNFWYEIQKPTKELFLIANYPSTAIEDNKITVRNLRATTNTENLKLFNQVVYSSWTISMSNILIDNKTNFTDTSKFICMSNGGSKIYFENGIIINSPTQNFYYGSNFTDFFYSWKTGKVGIIPMTGKGLFQQKIDEAFLLNKHFVKKVA